jgi:hypothetical protein
MTDSTTDLDSHAHLFLNAIEEAGHGGLRLVVQVGTLSAETKKIQIAGSVISSLRQVSVGDSGPGYEVTFADYIAYAVRNESYVLQDKEDAWAGKSFRIYSKSRFLDFVRSATFASPEYPGPFMHYSLVCQDHVVDIASVSQPKVERLG